MGRKKIFLNTIITTILISIGLSTVSYGDELGGNGIVEKRYSAVVNEWKHNNTKESDGVSLKTTPSQFNLTNGTKLTDVANSNSYNEAVLHLNKGEQFSFNINVPQDGLYNVKFDYYLLSSGLVSTEGSLQVNDKFEYYEARRVVFPALWKDSGDVFPRDRYDNEIMPDQQRIMKWQSEFVKDPSNIQSDPLLVQLKTGNNTMKFQLSSGEMLIGDVTVMSPEKTISYEQYKQNNANAQFPKDVKRIKEAEKPDSKNDTSINPIASRDISVVPYDTNKLLLNTIGGDTFKKGGQTLFYNMDIPQDGMYKIGFKYLQASDNKANARVYRTITIDDQVPFQELKHYAFDYTTKWKTNILGDGSDDYYFYLTKGVHKVGITVDIGLYSDVIDVITNSLNSISDLSLQIKKLIGSSVDQNRDWNISDYMPNISTDLNTIADNLNQQYDNAVKYNDGNKNSSGLIALNTAIGLLGNLSKDPNKIPNKISQLSEGTGSVAQSLSQAMTEFENQPLQLDQVYVLSKDQNAPGFSKNIFIRIWEAIKRFFNSFFPKKTKETAAETTINVWVNRPRNYMDAMQKLADEDFTPKTGIKINFSLLPNEQKLILSDASSTNPDVALGISNYLPFDLGIRGAALNLRQFKDFDSYIGKFSPGALLPMIVDDNVYGMPETQDFYTLFYRKDILNSLGIPIPKTWEDVINILPELQRYGMNFYTPIAGSTGMKPFMATSPFIYQNGGNIYNADGTKTAIDQEATLKGLKLMTDLFTIYGMPMQVPNFFDHFRNGTLPIGISNFTTYVQMMNAAPELKGSWAMAPSPGVMDSNGTVERWQTGSAQVSLIFKNTKYPEQSWEFLKWWMSTDVQVKFATQLQTLYGGEYMWNTANLEAFKQLPWPEEDKKVILEQWNWLREVPKSPAGYMAEREISNAWSKVVMEGKNLRASVDDSVLIINKEFSRKLEEFGYMKNGEVIRPYHIPTIEEVEGWVKKANGK